MAGPSYNQGHVAKFSPSPSKGGGVKRILFFGSSMSTGDNKYIIGATVGAQSSAVRSALMRRASNNAQGLPCCKIR